MRIVTAGGGSGGHVTPVLAVLQELKPHCSEFKAYFITDRKFSNQAQQIIKGFPELDLSVKKIYAGKLRRYSGVGKIKQLLHAPTTLRNLRDIFLVMIGFIQSVKYIRSVKPDVVFTKGGFVCLPVGLAARFLKVPLVIHDSDSHAGLTNRILSRFAVAIGTGAPLDNYSYPKSKTHYTGIPVDAKFMRKNISKPSLIKLRKKFGINDPTKPLVLVTGGGLGSRSINRLVKGVAPSLLKKASILHYAGVANLVEAKKGSIEHPDYVLKSFTSSLVESLRAADVVICRAGASTIAEFAAMGKAAVLIPSPYLAGEHQVKNASVYQRLKAAVVVQEKDVILDNRKLLRPVVKLVADEVYRNDLADRMFELAKPHAAIDMASIIVDVVSGNSKK